MSEDNREIVIDESIEKEWRGGVYMCTARNSFEADIFESKLRGELIPVLRRYRGAGNFIEITMGSNAAYPIDLYVPKDALEDARNIVVAIPLVSDDPEGFDGEIDEEDEE